MKVKKNNIMIENKGFSIVELLIAVAIAAIVGASVFSFMSVGAKTFSFNSADVNIQNESQLAFNQMQELIIDTAVGVEYYNKDTNSIIGTDTLADDSYDKLLRLYNLDVIYEIWWDHDDEKLYYSEYAAHVESSVSENKVIKNDPSNPEVGDALMSEYITGFAVDLSRLISNRVVRVDFTYEKGGRKQSSSHNITLRNQVVSSNKLEEHLKEAYTLSENTIPHHIEGKKIIYAEPGETVQLASLGYKVFDSAAPPNDITAEQPLVYAFASGSLHRKEANPTTIDYSTGVLKVSAYETAGHFDVLVYCSSDNSVKLPVTVRVVYDKEITISCNKITTSDAEHPAGTGGEVFLKAGDIFELEATPEITWTKAKAIASLPSEETLDPEDEAKLVGIENEIKKSLYFEGGIGYGLEAEGGLFYISGSPAITSDGKKARFQMSSSFSFETGKSGDYYVEKISEFAICGYSKTKIGRDVKKEWDLGRAYRKKGDYHINRPTGKYSRGVQRNEDPYEFSNSTIEGLKNNSKYAEFLEVYLYEEPDRENSLDVSKWKLDTTDHGHLHWWLPMTMNPTKRYTFKIISHIGDVSKTSLNGGDVIYLLPHDPFTKDSNYYKTSDPLYFTFDKLRISYSINGKNSMDCTNIDTYDVPGLPSVNSSDPFDSNSIECPSKYVQYYVREFGKAKSQISGMKNANDVIVLPMSYNDSFYYDGSTSSSNYDPKNEGNDISAPKAMTEWAFQNGGWYTYVYNSQSKQWESKTLDVSLVKGDRDANVFTNNKNSMFVYRADYKNGSGGKDIQLMLHVNSNKWSKDMPSRVRLIPKYVVNQNIPYAIEDNYVECVFWNIKVPYKPSFWQNIIDKIAQNDDTKVHSIDGSKYETCYFPAPGEPGFPNRNVENATWNKAGFDKSAGYQTGDNDEYDLRYDLKKQEINGVTKWKLTLKWEEKDAGSNTVDIADYEYDAVSMEWIIK